MNFNIIRLRYKTNTSKKTNRSSSNIRLFFFILHKIKSRLLHQLSRLISMSVNHTKHKRLPQIHQLTSTRVANQLITIIPQTPQLSFSSALLTNRNPTILATFLSPQNPILLSTKFTTSSSHYPRSSVHH